MPIPPILQVGDVLLSSDILTEYFCCDLEKCKGACCIEGDAGAPVTTDEILDIEDAADTFRNSLSPEALQVIDKQGVAYIDQEGDLVTSIVNGKDCVFTTYGDLTDRDSGRTIRHCCLCAIEQAQGQGRTACHKPISCALYPIRMKRFHDGTVGLNYHRWDICKDAREKGRRLNIPLHHFLRGPLVRLFGQPWYDELETLYREISKTNGMAP